MTEYCDRTTFGHHILYVVILLYFAMYAACYMIINVIIIVVVVVVELCQQRVDGVVPRLTVCALKPAAKRGRTKSDYY